MRPMREFSTSYDKTQDTVKTERLLPIFKEFLENTQEPFDSYAKNIEEFEYISRSGFSAFAHNRGGLDLIMITDAASLIGSGELYGLAIEKTVLRWETEEIENVKQDNPEMTDEEIGDQAFENLGSDYHALAWRVRVMYNGNNELTIHAGYDLDAPYFRWTNKENIEIKVSFKNKRDLKAKLNKCLPLIEAAQEKMQKDEKIA